mgnify:CR=1 FL=1
MRNLVGDSVFRKSETRNNSIMYFELFENKFSFPMASAEAMELSDDTMVSVEAMELSDDKTDSSGTFWVPWQSQMHPPIFF